ncbi:MAG TPA: hypothetical protein VF789_30605 [Thermoanaerobaculia bacterium]
MPPKPPLPSVLTRAPAKHVQDALARAAQAKLPERRPPLADHVRKALQPAQAKIPERLPVSRPQAPHVQAAVAVVQKATAPSASPGRPAPHVQKALREHANTARPATGAVLQQRKIQIPGFGEIETSDYTESQLNAFVSSHLTAPGTLGALIELDAAIEAREFKPADDKKAENKQASTASSSASSAGGTAAVTDSKAPATTTRSARLRRPTSRVLDQAGLKQLDATDPEEVARAKRKRSGLSFIKATYTKIKTMAPQDAKGRWCPTCGERFGTELEYVSRGRGRHHVDKAYTIDHYPDTWAKRLASFKRTGKWKIFVLLPEVLKAGRESQDFESCVMSDSKGAQVLRAAYQEDVRMQCRACNIGHQWEGKAGPFEQADSKGSKSTGSYRAYGDPNYVDSSDEEDRATTRRAKKQRLNTAAAASATPAAPSAAASASSSSSATASASTSSTAAASASSSTGSTTTSTGSKP